MEINLRKAKSLITKSNIPKIDFVINPYVGCQHGCIYCYAEFMIRFTGHKGDKWGEFLDIKTYEFDKIKPARYDGKKILLSSVTDPYLPLELKYENTRKILEKLVGTKAEISVLTKSKFVTRDIDLFKKFENIEVGISINTLDSDFAKLIEKGASRPRERLKALKEVHDNGIKTYTFISPFFPQITDYRAIIEETKAYTDSYMFENLNFRPHNVPRILKIIKKHYPGLIPVYQEFRKDHTLWDLIESEIESYCEKLKLTYKIEFHHGGFSKS
ncbi:MAG: radical SAM protein [Candidatus Lokiarchaeota archaeon]|nr:radical SAM protein [Candidatus Lokiarchaeota archaeon]